MTRFLCGLVLAAGVATGAPAFGEPESEAPVATLLYAVFPLAPDTAREVAALLRSPERVAADLGDATAAVLDAVPAVPGALWHDVLDTPFRHLRLAHALVTDVVELGTPPAGGRSGLFGHTLRALHRSALFTTAAGLVRRTTRPENRTVRLAIVVMARANGLPLAASDLDLVHRAIDGHAPDLAPLLARTVDRLVAFYGREAVRVLLSGS